MLVVGRSGASFRAVGLARQQGRERSGVYEVSQTPRLLLWLQQGLVLVLSEKYHAQMECTGTKIARR